MVDLLVLLLATCMELVRRVLLLCTCFYNFVCIYNIHLVVQPTNQPIVCVCVCVSSSFYWHLFLIALYANEKIERKNDWNEWKKEIFLLPLLFMWARGYNFARFIFFFSLMLGRDHTIYALWHIHIHGLFWLFEFDYKFFTFFVLLHILFFHCLAHFIFFFSLFDFH